MKRATALLLAVAAVLAMAGCSDDDEPAAPVGTAQPTNSASAETEASSEYRHPAGLTIKLVKLEQLDRKWGANTAANETLVQATISIENTGKDKLDVQPDEPMLGMRHGVNRTPVNPGEPFTYINAADEKVKLVSQKPTQIVPGSTITVAESFNVPTAALDALVVDVTVPVPGAMPAPYTFTGAEALLKK